MGQLPKDNKRQYQVLRLNSSNGLSFRTSNLYEGVAAKCLFEDGYTVIRRGWPDLLAVRGEDVRFIEVKDGGGYLKRHQLFVARVLSGLGVDVEVWPSGDETFARLWTADSEPPLRVT